MELIWQRVSNINELKIGDIIRTNYEDGNHHFILQIFRIKVNGIGNYPNTIFYKKTFAENDNKLEILDNFYHIIDEEHCETFDAGMHYNISRPDVWTEKLILPIKINNLEDEIDLLLDCVFN